MANAQAALEHVHKIDDVFLRRRCRSGPRRDFGFFLPQHRDEGHAIAVLKKSGVEVCELRLHDVLGESDRLCRQLHLRNFDEIIRLAADLMRVAQRDAAEAQTHRFENNRPLTVG